MLSRLLARSAPMAVHRNFSQQGGGARVYTGFKLYKPQVALNMLPVPPRLKSGKNSLSLSRAGFVSFELAPATAVKGFDWKSKQYYLLTSVEIGAILASDGNVKFVREPYAGDASASGGSSAPAAMRRIFSLSTDAQKLTYTLGVQSQGSDAGTGGAGSSQIQLSRGEYEVIKSLLAASLPKLILWEHGFEPIIDPADGAVGDENSNFGWSGGSGAMRK